MQKIGQWEKWVKLKSCLGNLAHLSDAKKN